MDVYLIQQAESKSKEEDPARPLTERGRSKMEAIGAHLVKLGIRFDCVFPAQVCARRDSWRLSRDKWKLDRSRP